MLLLRSGRISLAAFLLLNQALRVFDELEHAYEDGDRAHFTADLADWRAVVERRAVFLERAGLMPLPIR